MKRRMGLRVGLLSILLAVLGTHVSAEPVPVTVHFSAAGDIAATTNSTAVLNKINTLNNDVHLALGDLSYGTTGQEQAWCDFVTSKVGAGYPFELVSGNHESNGLNGNINDFSSCLPNQLPGAVGTYGRQYYVDVPAAAPLVRFIMISPSLTFPPSDTYSYTAGTPRYLWTSQTIDAARAAGIPWVVVGMHKPCVSVGKYPCDPGSDLFNLLLNKKVDLVLSGHDHSYQRTKQLSQSAGCTTVTPGTYNSACVADADSDLVKGAGTVAAIVGTGGNSLYDVNAADTEAAYFAAMSGANSNPTWGVLDMVATADSLQASFERASGGTFADSFTITRSAGTPNQPPVASFTSSCTDLSCAFDGSGSSDPEGSIASYAWNFGDGSTGTGSAPSHLYPATGSYSVALTVTDGAGATGSTTRTVTVTNPTTTVYVSDQFSRTLSSGFGTAPTGGNWTYNTTSPYFSVADGYGSIRVNAGTGPAAYLASVSAPSADLRMSFALDKQPTGSGLYLTTSGRRISGAGAYAGKVRIVSTGAVSVELMRLPSSGSEVSMQAPLTISGLTHAVGDTLNLRLQVVGASPTTIRAKVWKAGTAEPTAWQRSVTDSTAGMQTSGSIGVSAYLSSSATNSPVTLKIDELTVTAP